MLAEHVPMEGARYRMHSSRNNITRLEAIIRSDMTRDQGPVVQRT